jgi:small conductance mechanosensitive channel
MLLSATLIMALTALGLAAVHLVARRLLAWAHAEKRVHEARRQQLVTLIVVGRWLVNVVLIGAAVLMLLATFGINVTPLLASVGVAGLAVSLGAQTLIKDLVGGLLIILENQYAAGDSIQVGDVSGEVEIITLRTTQVRAANGDLYTVPNGEVRILANQTRDWSRVVVDLGVAYEEDLDRVQHILEESAAAFAGNPTYSPYLLEPPQVLGVVSLGDWGAVLRVTAKTTPGEQWITGRQLRRQLLATCEREGISLGYPGQEMWVRGATSA